MATENEMRTLIALGAFSSVQGGGGDIPEDLTLNSLTACSVDAGQIGTCGGSPIAINAPLTAGAGVSIYGSTFANGPVLIGDCGCNPAVKVENIGGNLYADGDLVHTVGTRPLQGCTLMRDGRYYYLNTDYYTDCLDFGGVAVAENETAEIWLEVGSTAPGNLTLPCSWHWVGPQLCTLCLHHFYDIGARNVKGVGTMANVAFDMPVAIPICC